MVEKGDISQVLEKAFHNKNIQQFIPQDIDFPFHPPLSFYDRHVDKNLLIKAVKPLPFPIAPYLAEFCDQEIKNFLDHGGDLEAGRMPTHSEAMPLRFCGDEPYDLAEYYCKTVANLSKKFASKFYLHSRPSEWGTVLLFEYSHRDNDQHTAEAGLVALINEKEFEEIALDDKMKAKLYEFQKYSPHIAIWEIFTVTKEAEALLRNMGGALTPFPWETHHTTGCQSPVGQAPSSDSKHGISTKISAFSSAKHSIPTATRNDSRLTGKVVIPMRKGPSRKKYSPLPNDYIQHIWTRAIENDATFIVINCGTLERICIRHRESQTLYISELIHPNAASGPPYRKVHIGLFLSIVQDALDRQSLRNTNDGGTSSTDLSQAEIMYKWLAGNKRPETDEPFDDNPNSKRRKWETDVPGDLQVERPLPSLEVVKELSSRELFIVVLDYGCYRSPVPASFLRLGPSCADALYINSFKKNRRRARYTSSQYATLTFGKPLGRGAIGLVHPVTATLELGSTTVTQGDLVIKLAFSKDQQDAMRHEFEIYKRLACSPGVEGVVCVYGLFQEMDTGILALVMDHAGMDLATREFYRHGPRNIGKTSVSATERDNFIRALKSIHCAGVAHRDIRMHNLTVKKPDQVFIIDFDRSEIGSNLSVPLKREINTLVRLFE